MKNDVKVAERFFVIVCLCILVPGVFLGILETYLDLKGSVERSKFEIEQFLEMAKGGSAIALWDLNPQGVKGLIDTIYQDERVEKVEIFDSQNALFVSTPSKGFDRTEVIQIQQAAVKNGEDIIGSVKIHLRRDYHMLRIYEKIPLNFLRFLALSVFSAFLVYFFFDHFFAKKVERLNHDANLLLDRKLEIPFNWPEGDEINQIGLILDHAREALQSYFQELNLMNERLENHNHELEKKVNEKSAELIHSARLASIGEMASGIAHEINNPLAAIIGKIDSLLMKSDKAGVEMSKEELREKLESIKLLGMRIAKIIKGLLSYSRQRNDEEVVESSVEKVLVETLDLCRERLYKENIELICPDLQNVQHEFIGQPLLLSQVFINLIINAADALGASEITGKKWINITIDNFKKLEADWIKIVVKDSGHGISKEIRDRIMHPFFTTKENGKGTGLGLSISKNIVDAHGGRFYLDTAETHTTFVIEIPRVNLEQIKHLRAG